jgi:hypothetical protein
MLERLHRRFDRFEKTLFRYVVLWVVPSYIAVGLALLLVVSRITR